MNLVIIEDNKDRRIAELEQQLADRDRVIAERDRVIENLQRRIERLERSTKTYGGRTSAKRRHSAEVHRKTTRSGEAGSVGSDTVLAGRDRFRKATGWSFGHLLRRIHGLIELSPEESALRWLCSLKMDAVPATNFLAGQALRPAVVNRKMSGGNNTPRGARAQEILMTVLHTARKRAANGIAIAVRALTHPASVLELFKR